MKPNTLRRKLHVWEEKLRRAAPVLAGGGAAAIATITAAKAEITELSANASLIQDTSSIRDVWVANLDALSTAVSVGSREGMLEAATKLYESLPIEHAKLGDMFFAGGGGTRGGGDQALLVIQQLLG